MNTSSLALTLQNQSEDFAIPGSLKRNAVLYFMRASVCPQCNRHARELDALRTELDALNMDVIIVVPEDSASADKVKTRNKLTVSVMAGNGSAHALAGLDKKFLGLIQVSGTIVVDATGTVLYEHLATNPENSYNEKDFKDFLATL